ncbi:MAG: hemin uptake protein HemP [Betaproteobacteria bacterium]|nr:hemin uptake protein HemP [Betaproteobacteria bacterium]
MKTDTQPASTRPELPRSGVEAPRPLDSAALLGAKGEIEITHRGETYRLRRTRQGKLILTK